MRGLVSEDGVPFIEPPTERGLDFFGRWEGYPGLNLYTSRCGECGSMLVIPNDDIDNEGALKSFAVGGVLIEDNRVRCASHQPATATAEESER